jgi:hypothetical protein
MTHATLILCVMTIMFIVTSLQNWLIICYLRDMQKSLDSIILNVRVNLMS